MSETKSPDTENPLVLKLRQRDRLSRDEERALIASVSRPQTFGTGEDIVAEGSRPTESILMLDGMSGRYKILSNGRRQITALHIAGDFVDLHSFLLKKMDHGVVALTPCRAAPVPHAALLDITEEFPHLTRMLWLSTLLDGANHRERLVAMGQLSAVGQVAHLVCEMYLRFRAIGQADGLSFSFPLSQAELGDVLGLSNVHVNRVIQELRGKGLITWRNKAVTIEDWDRLAEFADFDPTYLHLENEPR